MYGLDSALKLAGDWTRLSSALVSMGLASQEVIWRRSMKLADGSMTPVEFSRMLFEKPSAFARAAERASIAVASRQDPLVVAEAAVKHIGAEAKRNARRLRRR